MSSDRTVEVNINLSYITDEHTTISGTSDSASITLSGFAIPVKYVDKSNKLTDLPTDDVVDSNGNYTINSSLFGVNSNDYTLYWMVGNDRYLPGDTLIGITSALTLTASVEKNCTVTYDPYYDGVHGVPYTKTAKSAGTLYTIPEDFRNPTLEGYTFLGWTVTSDNAILDDDGNLTGITGDVTLTAQWAKNGATHTVSFLPGAADAYIPFLTPATVEDGQNYQIPDAVPTREGYTFAGWSDGQGNIYQAGTPTQNVTGDLLLTATWVKKPVTITITNLGSTSGVTTVPTTNSFVKAIGDTVNLSVTVPAQYSAAKLLVNAGSTSGEHKYLAPNAQYENADGSVILYYQFTATEAMTDNNNGQLTLPVLIGEPTVKTYTVTLPVSDKVEVSFTAPEAAVGNKSTEVDYNGSVTFTVAARTGYTVKGVYANGVKLNPEDDGSYKITNITADQTVTVDVEAIQFHKVTYVVLDKTYLVQDVQNGQSSTVENPVVEGYRFDGWYTKQGGEGEKATLNNITEDIVVYAKLTANTYTITYDLNGADGTAPTAQNKTHGQAVQLDNAKPTREGYKFLGWGTTANATTPSYQPGDMYSVDANITLYAVWEINKCTVTLPAGAGYTTAPTGANYVDWGSSFGFTVIVDREYAANEPAVKYSTDGGTTWNAMNGTGAVSDNSAATWMYTIQSVKTNCIVSIDVARNTTYTVSFITATLDNGTVTAGDAFLKQSVEHGYYASTPTAPERAGFKFLGYYAMKDTATSTMADYESFPFEQQILKDTNIYAIYEPIKPVITWPAADDQVGYTLAITSPNGLTNGGTVAYNDKVAFTITVADGYDATGMQVGVNGALLAPTEKNGNVYTFEFTAKEDTKITVVGIERKTITITYSANARDDVSGMPSPQVVKYYLENTADNDKLTTQEPKRTGYTFLGWNTDSEATAADTRYTVEKIRTGAASEFTQDTTLYAIWQAQDTELTLSITDVALKVNDERVVQYEGEEIALQATLNASAKGSVVFYKASTKADAEAGKGEVVGTVDLRGSTAELRVKVGEYKTADKDEYYWAVFKSEADEGYADSKQSNIMNVGVFSKALSWKIGTDSKVADNGNVLNIYEGENTTSTPITDSMIAGHTYTLEVKTDSITGVETLSTKQPVLGKDYKIVWQYTEVGKNDWKTDGEASDKATYLVTGDKSGYQFRAQIVPLGPDNGSLFVKAGKFTDDTLVNDQYDTCLYTKSTKTTVKQATVTALTIDAPEESKDVKINGATPFTAIGEHKAQFEGQTVTLTAKVTKENTATAVETGYVKFYRYVDGTTDTLLNTTLISVDANGIATLEVATSAWGTAKSATENKDEFYAVYETNDTYNTSKSATETVYIKSAKLQTPVIDSNLEGTNGAKATTYNDDLTGLLAGVQHTFTLRQDAGQTKQDYSVVALDGRSVDAANYTIEWQYKTGDNFATAGNDSTAVKYTTTTTKDGDRYRVKLTGKGVFADSEATSKDAVIGTKQDVTVTVKAIDAITKTPVDRENGKYPDVYQLNEITLTATVAAANDKATMQPTGTVTFYYKDGDNWVKLDSITLADATDGSGSKIASIKTDKLPVTDTTNTKRDVEITAVYSGDATFNASGNYDSTNSTVSAGTTENGVKDDTVTVYSSVVFNCEDENKNQTTDNDKGIHISVSDGAFKANEKATLALSDIYTLDRGLTGNLLDTIAKLNPNTDYTIQWQKLNGATAITGNDYSGSANWTPIDNATGTTLVLDKVEQDTAYRAVITVNEQPITKGSYKEVEQAIKGRQVYYSNVLMPTDTSMTVSVAINTGKTGSGFEGITEGETVTANVFLSGVVGTVPNANVTATITNDSAKGNDTAYEKTFTSKNTVNGWNAFDWDTTGVAPGFYTLTVSATTNTGYAAKEITRSLIVRESSYNIEVGNLKPTYNGRTQGLTVELEGFDFHGTAINEAASKSWTVKYYVDNVDGLEKGALVEPTQAGTYKAVVTLPASAYWTENSIETTFTIKQRSVSIADAIAQAKVYDGTTDVNIVEVMLNDAETAQGSTGLPTGNTGIINGDSIYAVATEAKLTNKNAGENQFTISEIKLRGDDADNYTWDEKAYNESIYVSRSQVYGNASTNVTLKAGEKLPADAVYMIDQAGNKITAYDVLYYLHTDTEIKKVDNTNEKGLYTVIARPKQDNYKSGVTLKVTVGDATGYTAAAEPQPSTLISISNTAELYGKSENTGIQTSFTNGATLAKLEYQDGTGWTETRPDNAGRYIVKVTASTGDVAYGIYTITKAHPSIDFETATNLTYNSMPQDGYTGTPNVGTESAESYFTYAGDVAIGYNTPAEGNVDEQAPVDAGTYAVTLHVNETANYTAHEVSKSFTIEKKALTIEADSWQTTQYDAFPDMTASYKGLAAETGDTTPDTSLRDVQIAPEFLYNPKDGKSNYSNDSLDQVGGVAIQPIDALSKNYAIFYENGEYTKQYTGANVDLAIHGLPQSSTGKNTVYYGDEIQLYPYGYYTNLGNGSGILEWSVTTATGFKGEVTIGKETGLLKVSGVGNFTVTLKRGVGEQQIKTEVNVTAIQKEAKIALKDVDKVYNGSAQSYEFSNVTVHDEFYQPIGNFTEEKLTRTNTGRTDIGTQITTAKVTGAWAYQSEIYGGKFTINDKEATVAPGAQSTVYGTLEAFDATKYTVDSKAGSVDPVTEVNVASQTDAYNRLDVHDGYEILVAGTENMNYNVKYTTDHNDTAKDAPDSEVKTYGDMKLYSTTTKAKNELNDATVYGEQANTLDWMLDTVKSTTRSSATYSDNLADFNLPNIFVEQDKDDCTGNSVTYKAANRTTEISGSTVKYNQAALTGPRTSEDANTDENYTLKFNTVENSGKALSADNYKLTNDKTGNSETTTNALTANSKGFITPATGESDDVSSENFVEGSANIAQRPIKLEQAVSDAQLYWKLPQSQLYTALVNVLKAEENSTGRGLAKGHTIEDLDLSFTIKVGNNTYNVAKNGTDALGFTSAGTATVTATVGDTNYKLENGPFTFDIVLKNIQIEATYTTKTFTGFTVLIKVHNEDGTTSPLNSAKGLSYKIFKKTGDSIDKTTAYASGTLTYQNRTAYDDKGGLCGVFTAAYPQLPLLNSGETYFIQMYEYGVELKTNS